jgi:hypothetical protein
MFSKNLSAIEDFNEWLGELPHRHKIVVPGNHEFFLESNPERRSLRSTGWPAEHLSRLLQDPDPKVHHSINEMSGIAPGAIVCDAGYPKNLSPAFGGATVFFGGLGQIAAGMTVKPDVYHALNRNPFPNVLHGCLLEGITLALEQRFEPFSQGRGFITKERVAEIDSMAARHGIHLAPFFNTAGPL